MGRNTKSVTRCHRGVTRVVTLFRYYPGRGVTHPPIVSIDTRGCDTQGYPRDTIGNFEI